MDGLREKMTELIHNAHKKCKANITCSACPRYGHGSDCVYLLMADYLVANGVTVQEWIPTSEPPKEPGEYIVAQKHWSDGHLETKKGKWNGVEWLVDGRESLMVTHWMPLTGTAERRMIMGTCANCKYAGRPTYKSPCSECKGYSKHEAVEIRTNGDRIRAMSDEQLAKHFSGLICDINEGVEYHANPNRWLEWLRQTVEDK